MPWPKPSERGERLQPGQTRPDRFRHLRKMTDDTGILEHAVGSIPRRKEGYSTDDQARALWICLEWLDLADTGRERTMLLDLADTYLAFLLWVQREDGHFHNNLDYRRRPEPETPSDDCFGRALWASAFAWVRFAEDPGRRTAAAAILRDALPRIPDVRSPRGIAYCLAAMSLLHRHRHPAPLERQIRESTDRLIGFYRTHAKRNWRWFEPALTYSNGILPWGLLWAHDATGDRKPLGIALESLAFLKEKMTGRGGIIRPVGNDGWCTPENRADFDQQPVDVLKLAMACGKAAELAGGGDWQTVITHCRDWFHGRNDLGLPLVDKQTGACCDGLEPGGVNLNQGAESTLSWLGTEMIFLKSRLMQGMLMSTS
jgi:hypothetical protein